MRGLPAARNRFSELVSTLAHAAESDTGLTFVSAREEETVLSFRELYARSRRFAGALRERGIRPGDRVALVLPTGPGFVVSFFGALYAGAVPVPLYPPVRLGRMDEYHRATAQMLRVSGARLVISDGRIGMLLGQAVAAARPELGLESVATLERSNAPELELHPSEDDLGLVQFSSGSTVDPKPVALSHHNLISQCAVLQQMFPEREGLRQLGVSWLPLYHDMGLIGCLLLAVYYPGPLVLIPPEAFLARPALWLRALSRHRGTISPAPNFAYGLCLKRIKDEEQHGVDLCSWTWALNGAEPVSVEVLHRFAERFGRYGFDPAALMPVYGLSEMALAVTFPPRRWPPRALTVDARRLAVDGVVEVRSAQRESAQAVTRDAPGHGTKNEVVREVARPATRCLPSVGTPLPGVEVEVRGEDGTSLGDDRVGRIFTRGPSRMRGYLGNAEATGKALRDGWLDTGDLGFFHEGELFVTGRARDLVIIRGANHAPQAFEDCVSDLPGVRTGCVVAMGFVPESSGNEELLIIAETSAPDASLSDRIRTAILERTGIRPHTVQLVAPGTLPRTSSGKLRRGEALRRYLANELAPPRPVNLLTVATEFAKSAAARVRSKGPG